MTRPGSFAWFARHEARLAWRDWVALTSGGKRGRAWLFGVGVVLFAIFLHLLALHLVGPFAPSGINPDRATLIVVTGCALLSFFLTLSQALETTTRVFYGRSDLDLILASPVSPRKVFAIRMLAIAAANAALAVPLAAPFINALAYAGGAPWLLSYGVVLAMAIAATALGMAITFALFRTVGPKRTRLTAQIIAALVGAAFVIGVQALAILSANTLSRFAALQSELLLGIAPDMESPFWWPARAIMGDAGALLGVLAGSATLFALATVFFAGRFAQNATAAAGVTAGVVQHRPRRNAFRPISAAQLLRRKEWVLLRRDPWLVSQSLMQVLYLLPPALLLWRNFGEDGETPLVLVPVIVMAAGQLAGGLAWLAVSGEDAPDLVATAPLRPKRVMQAKIEAVICCIAVVMSPMILALAFASLSAAVMAIIGILVAAGSATLIQLWFRTQAKRTQFRRRQTSSRVATFAEAFSSISWASAAGMAANGAALAIVPALIACLVLAGARAARPR